MNSTAVAGIVGSAVGFASGVIAQENASQFDRQAGTRPKDYIANGLKGAATMGLGAMGLKSGYDLIKNVPLNGKTINQVAESIAGSNYAKTILPNMEEEVSKYISNSKGLKNEIGRKSINNVMESLGDANITMTPEIQKAISKFDASNLDDSMKVIKQSLKTGVKEGNENLVDVIGNRMNSQVKTSLSHVNAEDILKEKTRFDKALMYPKAYFTNPDKKVVATRAATAVGVYGAGALGARYLSGGTPTTDNYGNRDIAGIPFV